MKLTTQKPTKSGYYWMQPYDSFGKPYNLQIVYVQMNYTFRKKVVPFVIALTWRDPLEDLNNYEWSERIECPVDSNYYKD
jgi:hypothetical protein